MARHRVEEQCDPGQAQPQIDQKPLSLPQTREDRLARFQREHPALYAARHVVIAALKLAIPLLGLGALATALLPAIDWSWAAEIGAFARSLRSQIGAWLPDIGLPLPGRPEWLAETIKSLAGQARPLIAWAKWIVPIIVATLVAIEEYQRHRRKRHKAGETTPAGQASRDEAEEG
jgi:hypothetical protein